MAEVQATHTECQYIALNGEKPASLKEREKLAQSEDVEKLQKVADDLGARSYDRAVARRRLKELGAKVKPETGEDEGVQYPIEKGGGYFELSDGTTIQGDKADAIVAEKELQGANEATDESSDYNYNEGVFDLIEAKFKDGGIEAVEKFTEGDNRKQVNELVEKLRAEAEEAEQDENEEA